MNPTSACHHCQKPIPQGQSFYEGKGVKVCLSCFRNSHKCQKCGFPTPTPQRVEGHGSYCSWCAQEVDQKPGKACFLCQKRVLEGMSHYQDHGQVVCQECFKDARRRCFLCRFPQVKEDLGGKTGICQFCQPQALGPGTTLETLAAPLLPFLARLGHRLDKIPRVLWMDINLVMGLQLDQETAVKIKFFDELVHYCYPLYQVKGVYYAVPRIKKEWLLPYLAGQLVAGDLCQKHQLPHLRGESPFHQLALGWCHWVAWTTASNLKYQQVARNLERWPQGDMTPGFGKLQGMSQYRKVAEVIRYAQDNLLQYSQKYL